MSLPQASAEAIFEISREIATANATVASRRRIEADNEWCLRLNTRSEDGRSRAKERSQLRAALKPDLQRKTSWSLCPVPGNR